MLAEPVGGAQRNLTADNAYVLGATCTARIETVMKRWR